VRPIAIEEVHKRTMGNVLREQAHQIGDDVWMMFGDDHYTYSRANELVNAYAGGLRAAGVGYGDVVALFMQDCPEYVFLNLALAKIGAVHVPINTAYKGEFLRHVLGHSRARMLIADGSLSSRLHNAGKFPQLKRLVTRGRIEGVPPSGITWTMLEELCEQGAGEPAVDVVAKDVMSVLYTSGTTGPSKGAAMSHHYWYLATEAIYRARDVREGDTFYSPTPMFHAGVWLYNIFSALMSGLRVGIDDHFSVKEWWERVELYGATQLQTIGAMHMFIWAQPPREDDADNPGRVWVPVPLPPALWEPFKERFGIEHLVFQYGQTEAVPVTVGAVGQTVKPGSAGRALPHLEVKILDADDEVCLPGVTGEICVRPKIPHSIYEGYYREPEETVAAWRNLWHHSGDLGRMDEDGELFYVDRKQDFLRRRGENISSFEVEASVGRHPAVAGVAAHAVPSDATEDELKVCVVLKEGETVSHEELAEFCKENLPYFAVPRYIEFMDEFPLTPTGRVQKYVLRERGVTPETWDREAAGFKVTI
jgi:crotonobetaine/carnitine-CoA ligase